jgi:fructose-bisphosphate aldolase class II
VIVTTAELVADAQQAGTGLGSFNVIALEHAEAVATACERLGRPALLQISENAVRYHGDAGPLAAACQEVAARSSADLALHLDHVTDEHLLRSAAGQGFSSVMFDASRLGYDDNVAATRAAADVGHAQGLWIEAELGAIGGKGGAHAPGVRTDPAEAADFVERTGVDGLAVAVGSAHAMTRREAELDHDLIARLAKALPVPLVLHGSSGVSDHQLRAAVAAGMVKVNVGTALNVAFTGAVRRRLEEDAAVVDPRRYLDAARDAMTDTVAHLLEQLGAPTS